MPILQHHTAATYGNAMVTHQRSAATKKAEPGRSKSSRAKSEKKAKTPQPPNARLKTVVRRLPPNLPEDIFWQSVQSWVTDDTTTWRKFLPGKTTKKYNKENIPSRAYIAFRDPEQLSAFSKAYNGHEFRDKSGNESHAIVEFAPHQKVPSEKKKQDPRMGTIEQDEDFISFMATLKAPVTKPAESETLEKLVASTQAVEEPKLTPLLEALIAEKQAQRDKETILKAHAHYRRGAAKELDKAPEEAVSRRRGKQPQMASHAERDEGASAPGQRRGKKGDSEESEKKKGKEREKGKEKSKKEHDKKDSVLPVHKIATRPHPKEQPKPLHPDAPQQTPATPQPSKGVEEERTVAESRKSRVRPAFGMARHFQAALDSVKKASEVPAGTAAMAASASASLPLASPSASPQDSVRDLRVRSSAEDAKVEKVETPEKAHAPTGPRRDRSRVRRKPERGIPPVIITRSEASVPAPASGSAEPATSEQTGLSPLVGAPEKRGPSAEARGGRRRGRARGQPPNPSGRGGAPEGVP